MDGPRKLIRPSLDASAARRPVESSPRRREAPPEATGSEEAVLARAAAQGQVAEIRLADGEVVSGRLEWVDQACLKLRRESGASVVVMKHAILSLTLPRSRG